LVNLVLELALLSLSYREEQDEPDGQKDKERSGIQSSMRVVDRFDYRRQ
jgi:hypothetical protein